jgi:hypothetical protein
MADFQYEAFLDHNLLGIAAHCMSRRILDRAVIGIDRAVVAILLQPMFARRAVATASDHAADTNRIPDFEPGHAAADGAHVTDDFMPGNAGPHCVAPFAARLMKIGMADAAISNIDLDIAGAGLATNDIEFCQRSISR